MDKLLSSYLEHIASQFNQYYTECGGTSETINVYLYGAFGKDDDIAIYLQPLSAEIVNRRINQGLQFYIKTKKQFEKEVVSALFKLCIHNNEQSFDYTRIVNDEEVTSKVMMYFDMATLLNDFSNNGTSFAREFTINASIYYDVQSEFDYKSRKLNTGGDYTLIIGEGDNFDELNLLSIDYKENINTEPKYDGGVIKNVPTSISRVIIVELLKEDNPLFDTLARPSNSINDIPIWNVELQYKGTTIIQGEFTRQSLTENIQIGKFVSFMLTLVDYGG